MYLASMILNFSLVWKTSLHLFSPAEGGKNREKRVEDSNISACLL